MAALLPNARLHLLDGNEHDPFIRDAGAVVEVILAFVDGRPLPTTATAEHAGWPKTDAVDAVAAARAPLAEPTLGPVAGTITAAAPP